MKAYLWLDEARDGFENMAIDEAPTHFAIHQDAAILRLYGWSRPFLTLGYFQQSSDRLPSALLANLPYTRRLSGGGAIVHDHELTYSLVFPDSKTKKSAASDIYCSVHSAIRACLNELGFDVTSASCSLASDPTTTNTQSSAEPFLCFHRRSSADLVLGAHKVVGSAQRRVESALLQHGSILLNSSKFAPELSGLNDLSEHKEPISNESLRERLTVYLDTTLRNTIDLEPWIGMDLEDLTSTPSAQVLAVSRQKFCSRDWIDKR